MENPVSLLVLACAVSLALSLGAVLWCALFSNPACYIKRSQHLETAIVDCVSAVEHIEAKWVAYKAELSAIHESIEGVLDSVERKRRRIAGAESRLNVNPEPEPQTREDLVNHYRAKIYAVRE